MRDYDFSILSSFEFECFVRDILRKRDKIDYSNFAEGRDGGIDLRASYAKGKTIIVQAKRYKTWSELKGKLKNEVGKVNKLKPDRYVVATSVDLSVGNVDEIIKMFSPYIKNFTDVLGKQELNKLLGDYPDVELEYYKLWLASKTVLDNFLNKHIINKTKFAIEELKETVRTFVMNPSFDDALNKLLKYHYVILSGQPGVGKTTLARMLSYVLMSKKYEKLKYDKFYFISNNLDDAYKMFQDGEREIFFFDDFLGTTRFQKDQKNFDSDLIRFIDEIRRRDDKLFIMTTREYILQDARIYYETLDNSGIEISKCIVDVGAYSDYVKGKILYNHLSDSGMSHEYIMAIRKNRNYMKLIKHRNYNPRIIESFIKQAPSETLPPDEYFKKILSFFENPTSVWEGAFNQLPLTAREMLLVLATMGNTVMYDDWKTAYENFYKTLHYENGYLDPNEWRDAVKLISNSFIRVDDGKAGRFVNFFNPGVEDFVINYISKDEGIVKRLINTALYIEQIYSIFSDIKIQHSKVLVPPILYQDVIDSFNHCWTSYRSCRTFAYGSKGDVPYYYKYPEKKLQALSAFYTSFHLLCSHNPKLISNKITEDILFNKDSTAWDILSVLNKINSSWVNIDRKKLFEFCKDNLSTYLDYKEFAIALEDKGLLSDYSEYKESDEFLDGLTETLRMELDQEEGMEYSRLDDEILEISAYVPSWDYTDIKGEVDAHNSQIDDYIDSTVDDYEFYHPGNQDESDDARIDNLFATLE